MTAGSKNTRQKAVRPPPREFTVAQFETLIRDSDRLVVAAFLAPWSRPCRLLNQVLEDIRGSYQGEVELVTVDADANPELGFCYEVESIPTLLWFAGGRMRLRHVGLTSKEVMLSMIGRLLQEGAAARLPAKEALSKTEPGAEQSRL